MIELTIDKKEKAPMEKWWKDLFRTHIKNYQAEVFLPNLKQLYIKITMLKHLGVQAVDFLNKK